MRFQRAPPRPTSLGRRASARGWVRDLFARVGDAHGARRKKKSERWRRGQVQISFTTMMILLAIIPLSTYTDLAIPFSAVDRSRFCPRGIARRPGCASRPSRRRHRKNRRSVAHVRESLRQRQCERGAIVASRRVAASAKRARAGNSVISHATPRALQSVVLGTLWVRRRHFWWGASPQRSNFSNPPYPEVLEGTNHRRAGFVTCFALSGSL